jgi:glycosyltransferase involved in cell wall biosynthesis
MNIYFYANHTFENWDYTNPTIKGIGGSEISQIEMSSRLAQRGHKVVSYAPVAWPGVREHRNVNWTSFETATFEEPGLWIMYRCPEELLNFDIAHPEQTVYFVAQDAFYNTLNEEMALRIDKFICLCSDHANYTAYKHPYLKDKIVISSNGINIDLINLLEAKQIERNPHRLIYSSSPDRGLEQLIPIFKKAKEFIPDLELHIFYGFDNIDKIIKDMPWVGKMKDEIMGSINSTPGIIWHGRVGQVELLIEWMKSGIWCYPINFTETSCISCMEAQACNVIPIVSPIWALQENVMNGIFVEGDVKAKLTIAKFAAEIVRVCSSDKLCNDIKDTMKISAKVRFNWERYVDQWECWMYQPKCKYFYAQYAFQQKYADGTILNVGCDSDASDFKGLRDAVNLDLQQNENNTVDVIMDMLGDHLTVNDKYDTVILGDMVEHMDYHSGIKLINNAKLFLNESGKLIITCPHDPRPKHVQNPTLDPDSVYINGISHFHRYISEDEFIKMLAATKLNVKVIQDIDYTHFYGTGVVATLC